MAKPRRNISGDLDLRQTKLKEVQGITSNISTIQSAIETSEN